jgi:hypothetical protein
MERVGVAEVTDTHKPDSFTLVPPRFDRQTQGGDEEQTATGLPLRRFRPPQMASVRVVRQRPVEVTSEAVNGKIVEVLGPYRASGDWWEQERWGVEEWDVDVAGQGLYRLLKTDAAWVVEGCYDARVR